jgi:hypothetical protein
MSRDLSSCPFCNAELPLPERGTPGNATCPRCGEALPFRSSEPGGSTGITASLPPVPSEVPVADPSPRRWSNRAVAGWVLAIMGAMMVLGFVYAQMTVQQRRDQDTQLPQRLGRRSIFMALPEDSPPLARLVILIANIPMVGLLGSLAYVVALIVYLVRTLRRVPRPQSGIAVGGSITLICLLSLVGLLYLGAITVKTRALLGETPPAPPGPVDDPTSAVHAFRPAELPGLGYLPPGTNVVVGIHVAEALAEPAGREFLTQFRVRSIDLGMSDVEKLTGVKLHDIDHLVLGMRVSDDFPPQAVLVVRTRRPYPEAEVVANLQAGGETARGKKKLYRFAVEKLLLRLVLWCPNPNTVVVAVQPEDLDRVSDNGDHLPQAVRDLLKKRMGRGTLVWVAGDVETWTALERALAFPWIKLPRQELTLVTKLRTFGVWLQLDRGVALHQWLDCADDAGAGALENYFSRRKPEEIDSLKVLGSRPGAEMIARELARSWKMERAGTVVTTEASASAEAVRRALSGQK